MNSGSGLSRRQLLVGLGTAGAAGVAPPTSASSLPSSSLPSRADILAVARRVNDHWISATTDPGDNKWARATYFSGDLALYRVTGVARYLTYAKGWAEQNNYAVNGGVATRHADNHTAGQVYYDLYDVEPEAAKLAAVNESIGRMVHGSGSATVSDWTWVDALHMAMPVFARVAAHTQDDRYLTSLYARYTYTKKTIHLYDYTPELWYRDLKYVPGGSRSISPNGQAVFWSRGNGWAVAAHAKTLGLLRPGEMRWPEYRYNLRGLARSLARAQRDDGFWNVNLVDPNDRGGPETSGTALFVFGLAYAIRTGIVDRATYLPMAARAWNGLVTAVHPDGFLGLVQGVGQEPASSQPVTSNSTSDFGVGAFLLAGAELSKLA